MSQGGLGARFRPLPWLQAPASPASKPPAKIDANRIFRAIAATFI